MMDSFELTKIAAGVLTALLVIFGTKTIIEINTGGHGHSESHSGYTLPMAEEGSSKEKAAGAAPAAFDPAAVATAAATADAASGEAVFKKCASCHTIDNGGANKTGPNLFGIVGRPKASHAGFSYSDDMKAKGGNWDLADLAHFLHKPKDFVPKTKMSFGGISDKGDLANLLAYLAKQK
ncbi:MAG: cytochrome c family protein [Hyphomicrobiaceae bacterium]